MGFASPPGVHAPSARSAAQGGGAQPGPLKKQNSLVAELALTQHRQQQRWQLRSSNGGAMHSAMPAPAQPRVRNEDVMAAPGGGAMGGPNREAQTPSRHSYDSPTGSPRRGPARGVAEDGEIPGPALGVAEDREIPWGLMDMKSPKNVTAELTLLQPLAAQGLMDMKSPKNGLMDMKSPKNGLMDMKSPKNGLMNMKSPKNVLEFADHQRETPPSTPIKSNGRGGGAFNPFNTVVGDAMSYSHGGGLFHPFNPAIGDAMSYSHGTPPGPHPGMLSPGMCSPSLFFAMTPNANGSAMSPMNTSLLLGGDDSVRTPVAARLAQRGGGGGGSDGVLEGGDPGYRSGSSGGDGGGGDGVLEGGEPAYQSSSGGDGGSGGGGDGVLEGGEPGYRSSPICNEAALGPEGSIGTTRRTRSSMRKGAAAAAAPATPKALKSNGHSASTPDANRINTLVHALVAETPGTSDTSSGSRGGPPQTPEGERYHLLSDRGSGGGGGMSPGFISPMRLDHLGSPVPAVPAGSPVKAPQQQQELSAGEEQAWDETAAAATKAWDDAHETAAAAAEIAAIRAEAGVRGAGMGMGMVGNPGWRVTDKEAEVVLGGPFVPQMLAIINSRIWGADEPDPTELSECLTAGTVREATGLSSAHRKTTIYFGRGVTGGTIALSGAVTHGQRCRSEALLSSFTVEGGVARTASDAASHPYATSTAEHFDERPALPARSSARHSDGGSGSKRGRGRGLLPGLLEAPGSDAKKSRATPPSSAPRSILKQELASPSQLARPPRMSLCSPPPPTPKKRPRVSISSAEPSVQQFGKEPPIAVEQLQPPFGKEPPIAVEQLQPPSCNCKKSRCLKLYCECFQRRERCGPACNCQNCHNTIETEAERLAAIAACIERNPAAFKTKLQVTALPAGAALGKLQVPTALSKGQGDSPPLQCKRSACLKRYCECYQGGAFCTNRCKCDGCKNRSSVEQATAAAAGAAAAEQQRSAAAAAEAAAAAANAAAALPCAAVSDGGGRGGGGGSECGGGTAFRGGGSSGGGGGDCGRGTALRPRLYIATTTATTAAAAAANAAAAVAHIQQPPFSNLNYHPAAPHALLTAEDEAAAAEAAAGSLGAYFPGTPLVGIGTSNDARGYADESPLPTFIGDLGGPIEGTSGPIEGTSGGVLKENSSSVAERNRSRSASPTELKLTLLPLRQRRWDAACTPVQRDRYCRPFGRQPRLLMYRGSMVNVLSFLNNADLAAAARVAKSWSNFAANAALWEDAPTDAAPPL
ncbi:hypothetical protein JKP88DRAFT_349447 [Tribonema minus]|uniref:CRC domain-containing protein n=1 Tax=Tribonema minus TaxID=303371 RepID=A0A836CBW6_9STRA|nr:hypothetical protein JKP88DRAFT_349447 [Tribonema minus]